MFRDDILWKAPELLLFGHCCCARHDNVSIRFTLLATARNENTEFLFLIKTNQPTWVEGTPCVDMEHPALNYGTPFATKHFDSYWVFIVYVCRSLNLFSVSEENPQWQAMHLKVLHASCARDHTRDQSTMEKCWGKKISRCINSVWFGSSLPKSQFTLTGSFPPSYSAPNCTRKILRHLLRT